MGLSSCRGSLCLHLTLDQPGLHLTNDVSPINRRPTGDLCLRFGTGEFHQVRSLEELDDAPR